MSKAIHYELYVTPPNKMDVTKEQFDNFSYYGIAAFLISWPFVIDVLDDGMYQVYGGISRLWKFRDMLYEELDVFEYESVEMLRFDIPKDHKLISRLDKYFSHLKFVK